MGTGPSPLHQRTVLATPRENPSPGSACRRAAAKPAGGKDAPGRALGAAEAGAGLQPSASLTAKGLLLEGLLPCLAARRVLIDFKNERRSPEARERASPRCCLARARRRSGAEVPTAPSPA